MNILESCCVEMSIIPVPCTSLLPLHLSPLTHNPAVNIGFAQTAYTTPEEDPNGQGSTVQVCIVLMGELDDDVEVVLTTMSGSAIGDTIMLQTIFSLQFTRICSITDEALLQLTLDLKYYSSYNL